MKPKTLSEAYGEVRTPRQVVTNPYLLLDPIVLAAQLRMHVSNDSEIQEFELMEMARNYLEEKGAPQCFMNAAVDDKWWTSTLVDEFHQGV